MLEKVWARQRATLETFAQELAIGRPVHPGPDAPPRQLGHWASSADEFDSKASAVSDLGPNFWAISAALRQLDRAAIVTEMSNEEWWVVQEVLTRFEWIRYHQDLLAKGKTVGYPFEGLVAPRKSRSRQRDREYFTLLLLIHWVRWVDGRQLLLEAVTETPDFIASVSGVQVGVEATEATAPRRAAQHARAEVLEARLEHLALELNIQIHVESTSGLEEFVTAWPKLEAAIRAAAAASDPMTEASITEGRHRCNLEVEPGKSALVLYSNPDGFDGDDLELGRQDGVDCLRTVISDKIAGTRPSVRPCILAVYPNFLRELNLAETLESAWSTLNLNVSSHFDEVWVVQEQVCQRLD